MRPIAGPQRVWELPLSLGDSSELPTYKRISQAIVDEIRTGRLRPGTALPGSRALAESLGLHRNTVMKSYRELATQGWVVAKMGGGTFVASDLPSSMRVHRSAAALLS